MEGKFSGDLEKFSQNKTNENSVLKKSRKDSLRWHVEFKKCDFEKGSFPY